jgi:hypothetical protein
MTATIITAPAVPPSWDPVIAMPPQLAYRGVDVAVVVQRTVDDWDALTGRLRPDVIRESRI